MAKVVPTNPDSFFKSLIGVEQSVNQGAGKKLVGTKSNNRTFKEIAKREKQLARFALCKSKNLEKLAEKNFAKNIFRRRLLLALELLNE